VPNASPKHDAVWVRELAAELKLKGHPVKRHQKRFGVVTFASPSPGLRLGDPLLDGHSWAKRSIELAALFSRGAIADVAAVRSLPALKAPSPVRRRCRAMPGNRLQSRQAIAPLLLLLGVTVYASKQSRRFDYPLRHALPAGPPSLARPGVPGPGRGRAM
jgi:hypothetical protein